MPKKPRANEYRRPLRIRLRKDDVIFYQHLPRTGGVSLITLLDQQFPTTAVFPLHAIANKFPVAELGLNEETRHPYRLVRGHFRFGPCDNTIYRYLARNPLWIATLREPVSRTLSAYHHLRRNKRIPAEWSMLEWLHHPDWTDRMTNHQAKRLTGQIFARADQLDRLAPDVLLHLAKENLEYMACFGVLDRYRESMQLFCYTFDWELPEATPHLNAAPTPLSRESLGAEERTLIESMTEVDKAVYAFALTLFDSRYSQLKAELGAPESAMTAEIDVLMASDYRRRHGILKKPMGRSVPLRSTLPADWGTPPKGVRKRAISIVRHAAPDGTRLGQLYSWARDTIQRAPMLAQMITGKKPKA